MSKSNYFLAAFALLMCVTVNAANYISLGDTVRIHPRYLDGYFNVDAGMHIEGMIDDWQMSVTYPAGMTVKLVAGITPLEGMTVSYADRYGRDQKCDVPLTVSAAYANISAHIDVQGYWQQVVDETGEDNILWDCYGSVKWLPGDHDMFNLNFYIAPTFRTGKVTFDGILTSGPDQRGAVLQGVHFVRSTYFWVGYIPGDVTGNDVIDIGDVTLLIDIVLGKTVNLDEFALVAADANRDGEVNIDDVTWAINRNLGK